MKIRRWEKMIFIYCFWVRLYSFSTVSTSFSNAQIKAPLGLSLASDELLPDAG